MRITHVMTFDQGSGPTSLVEIQTDDSLHMLRIVHNARFDKVKEVDPAATRRAIDAAANLGDATTKVRPDLAQQIAQETLRFASTHGCTSQAMRWGEDGSGLLFRSEVDAVAWSDLQKEKNPQSAPEPVRRRMIMG